MLARLFVFFGSLLVLALLAALVGPYFVDWTGYRTAFEREASAVLGRKVEVRGDASARILPFPSLSFADVVVGGADGQPALTAESFSMDAELAPFMSGEVLIFDMRLVRPKAVLKVAADGVVDWAVRPSTPFDPKNIEIENLSIVEGQIRVEDGASGRNIELTEINTTVSARSLNGPWRVGGSLRVNGKRSLLTASTGVSDGSGSINLNISASPEAFPVKIDAEGNATVKNGALSYAGNFRAIGVRPAAAELRGSDGAAPAQEKQAPPNRLSGKFAFAQERLDIESFRFENGPVADPYVADGSAFIDLGKDARFSVVAKGAQFRLTEEDEAKPTDVALSERVAALEEFVSAFPRPTIPGGVEINLPAVVAGDTTIRDLALSAEPQEGGWRIKSASALLPGRSTLEAAGFLATGEVPRFEGSLLLAIKQPSGFAAWLSKDVGASMRRLTAAGFRADVMLDAERQRFDNLELILGNAKLTGAVERISSLNVKPVMVARLAAGQMDAETGAALVSLFTGDKGSARFAAHDLDVQVKAGPVSLAGLSAAGLDAAVRLKDNRLDIDRLSVSDVAGASLSATGSVRDLAADPIGDVDATVIADDLQPALQALAQQFPDIHMLRDMSERALVYPGLLGNTRLDVVASAAWAKDPQADTDVALSIKGNSGGSAIAATVSGPLGALGGDKPLSASVEIANPDAAPLLALAGLQTFPLATVGQGKLAFDVKGAVATGLQTNASLQGDGFLLRFAGTAQDAGEAVAARGKVELQADDFEPWMMTLGAALPSMGFGTSAMLSMNADYSKGLLVLNDIGGTIGESTVAGDLNAEFGKDVPALSGALALDTLDLEPLAALVLGPQAIAPTDGLSWPTTAFQEKPLAPFSAEIELNVGALAAGVLLPLNDVNLSLKLDGSGIRASNIVGQAVGGTVNGLVELTNEAGAGLLSGQLSVKNADLSLAWPAFGFGETGVTGRADISASVTSTGKSVEAMAAALAGSGAVSLREIRVSGLNDQALPRLIAQADAIGRNIDEAATAGFAPGMVQTGEFDAGAADFAFNIASGVVRMPATTFARDKAVLTVEARADVGQQTVAGDGAFAYRPGEDALVGSEPVVRLALSGPINAPQLALDTAPLAQFLTQRQLEIEQARVEAMQAGLLEKQRLRREAAYYAGLQKQRAALAAGEAARRNDLIRLHDEAEARRKAAEEAAKQEAIQPGEAPPASQPTPEPKPADPGASSAVEPPLPAVVPQPARRAQPAPKPAARPDAEAAAFPPAPAADFPPAPQAPASTFGDFLRSFSE